MIRSATIKLTLWYLMLIMALSIGFSVMLYHVSSQELERGVPPRPGLLLRELQPGSYEQFREVQLGSSRSHLRGDLVLFNLAVLILGGGLSYALAIRHIRPIEDALTAQSRFTADASHELRTPLTAMQTEIEVSLRDPKLTKEETRELLESNLEEVGKLRVLSDSLLRLAQGNGKDLELKPVALDGVAEEAIARFAKAAKAKSIKVHNQVKASEVMGDHESLVEVMAILLDNAIKYSDKQTSITLSSETHGKYGLLSVKDEGQGLKASDIPHIFERFYRADTSRSKQRVEGYGLGLSIAKQIAAAHKGEIEVESAPGKGSTFTVKVPLTNT